MTLTPTLIRAFAPHARQDIVDGLVAGWPEIYAAGIDTPLRLQHFMAQLAVESQGLTRLEENLNYTTAMRLHEVWPSRFPTVASAAPYVRNPQGLANKVYGHRADLGNVKDGDGWAYRGGGLIQTTGRANYRAAGFENDPDGLRHMPGALRAALTFWRNHRLNNFADHDDLTGLRRAVNGGLNGLQDARTYLAKAKTVFHAVQAPQRAVQRPVADLAISQPPRPASASSPFPAALAAIPQETTTMDGIKGILASRTIWMNLFTLIAGTTMGAKVLHNVDGAALIDWVMAGVGIVGPILSSIFRYTATKQLVVGASTSSTTLKLIPILIVLIVASALVGCNAAAAPPVVSAQPVVVTGSGAVVPVTKVEASIQRYCPAVVRGTTLLTFAASFQHSQTVADDAALAAKIARAFCAAFA